MESWSPTETARRLAALCAALALGACATAPGRSTTGGGPVTAARPGINLSGYSAAFKEGYADGCESARGAPRRNAKRYGTDTDYTMGWNDGQAMCARGAR